jgi:hypothetical protein
MHNYFALLKLRDKASRMRVGGSSTLLRVKSGSGSEATKISIRNGFLSLLYSPGILIGWKYVSKVSHCRMYPWPYVLSCVWNKTNWSDNWRVCHKCDIKGGLHAKSFYSRHYERFATAPEECAERATKNTRTRPRATTYYLLIFELLAARCPLLLIQPSNRATGGVDKPRQAWA